MIFVRPDSARIGTALNVETEPVTSSDTGF